MLKLTITNPNTQAIETYDMVTEFNQMFERAKEYGKFPKIPKNSHSDSIISGDGKIFFRGDK